MSADSSRPPRDLLAATVRVPPHVVYRVFPLETVVLNLHSGNYHGLDPVGGRMLELLDRLSSVRAVADRMAGEYRHPAEEVERDLCELCRQLMQRGLIEIAAAGTASQGPDSTESLAPFQR